jgi:hypothetical protein
MFIRQFLISTIALAVIPPAVLCAAHTVEYVGGTAKSIPMNATGSLNVDTKELRFVYGQGVYKLPYDQITGTEISRGEKRHVLKKIPVPSLFPGRKKETLSISYKDASGVTGTLNFELSARQASAAQDAIEEQKAAPAAAAAAGQAPTEWWGDRYWKTTRNKATWETDTTTATQQAPEAASPKY